MKSRDLLKKDTKSAKSLSAMSTKGNWRLAGKGQQNTREASGCKSVDVFKLYSMYSLNMI